MKYDKEAALLKYNQDVELHKERVKTINHDLLLDDDGYPTEYAIDIIQSWHWSDPRGWFDLIQSIWYMRDWGWKEAEAIDEIFKEKNITAIYVSTAGWSGNESIIKSMQKSDMLWYLTWVQSRRGGHYIFEIKDRDE
jgi:hypothetical protein